MHVHASSDPLVWRQTVTQAQSRPRVPTNLQRKSQILWCPKISKLDVRTWYCTYVDKPLAKTRIRYVLS
jgi:hypothetical protein